MTDLEREESAKRTKEILRERGLCGYVSEDHACILTRYHDDNVHERGWGVVTRFVDSGLKRDAREPDDVVYDVIDVTRTFSTTNKADAEWLAKTLSRLDL